MPYLDSQRKAELADVKRASKDGDYNFLFSVEFLNVFIEDPSYATIALIAKSAIVPHRIPGVEALEDTLTFMGVPLLDRQVARQLAFAEFYSRIGSVYEGHAREKNGDLREYIAAESAIAHKFAKAEK